MQQLTTDLPPTVGVLHSLLLAKVGRMCSAVFKPLVTCGEEKQNVFEEKNVFKFACGPCLRMVLKCNNP
jgi:hypothetical protein